MPDNGYLSLLPNSRNTEDQSTNIQSFTQALINENRVLYVQSGANSTSDKIVFNVSNGMVWLYELTLNVEIIPEHLYIGSNPLTVNEGGVTVVTPAHIFIVTDYYKSRVTDYIVMHNASYGCIQIYKKCTTLYKFSQKELVAGVVHYAHDGSENMQDELVLVAVVGKKRSSPVNLVVNVLPVNDQKPKLIRNTGLSMWEGGAAVITNSMLGKWNDFVSQVYRMLIWLMFVVHGFLSLDSYVRAFCGRLIVTASHKWFLIGTNRLRPRFSYCLVTFVPICE